MRPDLFPVFIWERLTWWSQWLNDKDHTDRADVIGAGTTGLVVALAVAAYVKRDSLKPGFSWIKAHPLWATAIAAPIASLLLINLSKFATFIGSTLTVVGLLIALENNRRNHDRETRKFEREGKSARAALALELSALTDYCKAYNTALNEVRRAAYGQDEDGEPVFFVELSHDVAFPDVPPTTVSTLKEIIKTTGDEVLADRCMLVLTYTQYVKGFAAVFREFGALAIEDNVNHAKLRTAILYSIVGTMFDFARGKSDKPHEITWATVDTATDSLDMAGNASFLQYLANHKHYTSPLDVLTG